MNSAESQKIMIVAGLGLVGFYFMTMRRKGSAGGNPANAFYRAGTVSPGQASQGAPYLTGNGQDPLWNAAGSLINRILNKPAMYTPDVAGMPHASRRDSQPYEAYEANFPTSSSQDGTPANPVQTYVDPFDANGYGDG